MRSLLTWALLVSVVGLSGCGWVQSLRREIEDDEVQTAKDPFKYSMDDVRRRKLPPPPTTVNDNRQQPVAGTPVDLSGVRAKTGRVTKNDFIAESLRNDNSLWSEEGQTNYLFARNKLKMPGDLIAVVIEDDLRNDMINAMRRLLPYELRDQEIRVPGLTKNNGDREPAGAGAGAAGAGGAAGGGNSPTDDSMTAEVLERYPNGNVRLRAIKRIPFKRRVVDLEVVSIVKGADISEDDKIASSKFFEQTVEVYK